MMHLQAKGSQMMPGASRDWRRLDGFSPTALRAFGKDRPADTLNLDFWLLELGKDNVLLF